MSRISDWTLSLVRRKGTLLAASLSAVACLIASATAANVDFIVPAGNYITDANWFNDVTMTNVAPTGADDAFVRNNGTVTVDSSITAPISLNLGFSKPDPNDPMIDIGMPGSLALTTGGVLNAPRFFVGQEYKGQVDMNDGRYPLLLNADRFTIGSGNNTTSEFNMTGGQIALRVGSNDNNGILVRRGSFNMSGGTIVDETLLPTQFGQRSLTIASTGGGVAVAKFTGTASMNVRGGIRAATSGGAMGTLEVDGANVFIGTGDDVSIGYNAGVGTLGVMNMKAGYVRVGGAGTGNIARLQIGHRGPGQLNMSGGTIEVTRELRVGAESAAGGSFIMMTDGTITTPTLSLREDPVSQNPDLGASIIIDGATASFTQNDPLNAFQQSVIGKQGVGLFEVRQGNATLNIVELGSTAASKGTLSVTGGNLKLTGNVLKTTAAAASSVIFTGGTLEVDTPSTASWQTSLTNDGGQMILKQNGLQRINLSDATHPASFAMNSGSWDIEIGNNTINGADWINVINGSGSINGGVLNISHIGGYTPSFGDTVRIVRSTTGVTLGIGNNDLFGDSRWVIGVGAGGTEIQLTYTPEPSTFVLAAFGLIAGIIGLRRSRA